MYNSVVCPIKKFPHATFNLAPRYFEVNKEPITAITFDQKEIERKKYLVGMKFCCASNAAIKNVKIAREKIHYFPEICSTKSLFF